MRSAGCAQVKFHLPQEDRDAVLLKDLFAEEAPWQMRVPKGELLFIGDRAGQCSKQTVVALVEASAAGLLRMTTCESS